MQQGDYKGPHRRLNLLTGEWVLVSPHRSKRPWSGQEEIPVKQEKQHYDPACYLCPGNTRSGGEVNPEYSQTFIFLNDFSSLTEVHYSSSWMYQGDDFFKVEPEKGICKVICYSPRHDLTIARMKREQVRSIISAWQQEYKVLGATPGIKYVQIFENRGEIMGCSNPHPHGQIWANQTIPTIPAMETVAQQEHFSREKQCLLCRYIDREKAENRRILFENNAFIVLVPFWAVWPFETMILPKRHSSSLIDLSENEADDLATILIRLCTCYDNLFQVSFPYSMGIHQQPTDGLDNKEWHWHIHFFPPLLRSATVKKHMVGYEMLAMPQRDITPEAAVEQLLSLPGTHYLDNV